MRTCTKRALRKKIMERRSTNPVFQPCMHCHEDSLPWYNLFLIKKFMNPFSPSHSLLYFYMKLKKNMIQSHIHTRFELTSIGFLKGLLQAKLLIGESEICNQALQWNKTCSSEDFWGRNLDNWNEAIKNNMEHEGNKLKSLSHNEVVLTNMNKMHANANICF